MGGWNGGDWRCVCVLVMFVLDLMVRVDVV